MKKRKTIVLAILLSLLGLTVLSVMIWRVNRGTYEQGSEISYYTCPMHPFVHKDKPGSCPVCQMNLVPVYKEPSSVNPLPSGGEGGPPQAGQVRGTEGVRISPERQQLIGLTKGVVQKKHLTKEIRTAGRVAFDPDLAIAQREFVEIAKNVPSLKPASVQRLKLLGMSGEEIRDLEKKGKPQTNLTLPEEGESVWVYAPLYEYEIPFVKIGDKAVITFLSESFEGTIRSIGPVLDPMTRSARARIEIPGAGGQLKPESYLSVSLQVDLGEQLAVPKSAVIDTGTRQVVFLVRDGNRFEAREVKLGPETEEDRVVASGLSEGDVIATSAAFLIDSESQLKAAVAGMGSAPSCPDGQAWDQGMSMCMPKTGS